MAHSAKTRKRPIMCSDTSTSDCVTISVSPRHCKVLCGEHDRYLQRSRHAALTCSSGVMSVFLTLTEFPSKKFVECLKKRSLMST